MLRSRLFIIGVIPSFVMMLRVSGGLQTILSSVGKEARAQATLNGNQVVGGTFQECFLLGIWLLLASFAWKMADLIAA